jgi:mannose-1-phosphate guanylyltransferase/mannose-6-phosphate isomerase
MGQTAPVPANPNRDRSTRTRMRARPSLVARHPRSPASSPPIFAVILAGGQGTRFWPRSRHRTPKQLLRLKGRHSLLQETARRMRRLVPWSRILVVTNQSHAAAVRRQLPRLSSRQVLVEPRGRGTLPGAALAARWVARDHDDAVLIVAPADHVIKDGDGWLRTMRTGVSVAAEHPVLVTFGVPPARPETGFGYIECGRPIAGPARAHLVRRFHEKPSARAAARYLERRFLWNSGMFVWRLSTFFDALRQHAPRIHDIMRRVWNGPTATSQAASVRAAFRQLPAESIDVGLLEAAARSSRGPRVAVVEAGFDWCDAGSWGALGELLQQDRQGNVVSGRVLAIDTESSVLVGGGRLIAAVGLRNMIVVDSDDALLLCPQDRAQDVRLVIEELRRRNWRRYL